jgi:hypothetical protein
MDPIYRNFFLNVSRLNGKVFDSAGSQLFRLERATDKLLPLLHPTSRPCFARSPRGTGLEAHTLQLIDEGASTRGSLINRAAGMNKKLGRRVRENAEKTLRSHLNTLNSLLNQFRK